MCWLHICRNASHVTYRYMHVDQRKGNVKCLENHSVFDDIKMSNPVRFFVTKLKQTRKERKTLLDGAH